MRKFICLLALLSSVGFAKEPITNPPVVSKIMVLGGGVGALTSSLYLARAGLEPTVIVGPEPGGLITQSHAIQNWPGEMEITGHALVEKMQLQAEANGVQLVQEEVVSVDFSKRPYRIITKCYEEDKTHEYAADNVIIAMGTKPNHLGIPGETGPEGYWGRGVTNCAVCDGNLYQDAIVGVVGGGDAAALEALYLANIAKEVHVFVRKNSFKAVEQKRLKNLLNTSNVKVHFNTTVEKIVGDGTQLTEVVLKTGPKKRTLPLNGLFLAIGSTPNSSLFKGALELDKQGYVVLKNGQETSRKGIYAIGDIVDPIYKQAISASGDGAKAALQVQQSIVDVGGKVPEKAVAAAPILLTPEVIEITSIEQFEQEIKQSTVPILVDFYANWCGPCKHIAPRIDKSAVTLAGQVKFLKVNVDVVQRLPGKYNIRAMPTVLLFQSDGEILERKTGVDQIIALLKKLESVE